MQFFKLPTISAFAAMTAAAALPAPEAAPAPAPEADPGLGSLLFKALKSGADLLDGSNCDNDDNNN
ncbi:hypothetical protein N7454_002425 [Penicillium verhagenii]|nr:hypothetical protein N7454_002425 [Penicillium verhagenii]